MEFGYTVFFFKQKTAYEMRISDWSSDVCSSDLTRRYNANVLGSKKLFELCRKYGVGQVLVHSTYFVYGASAFNPALLDEDAPLKIGRASCRERVCQDV